MASNPMNLETVSIDLIDYYSTYPNGKNYGQTFFTYTIPFYNPLLYTYAVRDGYVYDSGGSFVDIKNNISIKGCTVYGATVSVTFNNVYAGRLLRIVLEKSN